MELFNSAHDVLKAFCSPDGPSVDPMDFTYDVVSRVTALVVLVDRQEIGSREERDALGSAMDAFLDRLTKVCVSRDMGDGKVLSFRKYRHPPPRSK